MFEVPERFFLYLDILGFKELMADSEKIAQLYQVLDKLNVHKDSYFHKIIFSDTMLVAADTSWNHQPKQAVMWLIEFAQDLFYHLSHRDIHFRAIITKGAFGYGNLNNFEAYHGQALVDCYLKEQSLKCCGVFLDNNLVEYSNIFHTSKYDADFSFVHVMQHIDNISWSYEQYPISGEPLTATGMEGWVAYLLRYLQIIHQHKTNFSLPSDVRGKYVMTWEMLSQRHDGLLRRLSEASFDPASVIEMDWSEAFKKIGTKDGAWG